MNPRIKRLIARMRNDIGALTHSLTRRDRTQAKLLADLRETSAELEVEVLLAIEELKKEKSHA